MHTLTLRLVCCTLLRHGSFGVCGVGGGGGGMRLFGRVEEGCAGARDLLEHAFPPLSLPVVRVTPGGGAVPVRSAEQKTALLQGLSALERVALHAAVGITSTPYGAALRDLAAVLAASPSLAWEAERGSDVAKCLGKCRPADGGGSGIGS
ncbi:hypothetical protein EMIHUDRAFT_112545 [Emiliania huxleyi CCMP1516]|uniref:Uncharacterized protein n=2 Tax=Emiliania huxleyi TaxID=2903 RepID=A0A0D3K7X4_EMIH1|nr:hypothetical protein EMIHUDRAFT_112545 [Emiliania huxleyi CCMP1516]EOD31859.1 hypothetical protein EMIHUDRAFT_112545 [Emiliania huxleyi CCMP1516]|eukprot:XP_005784288.1 hypothetical protein EMIHUDRAFT_112545 [Emiliania huxleyi CCMP1516]